MGYRAYCSCICTTPAQYKLVVTCKYVCILMQEDTYVGIQLILQGHDLLVSLD